MTSSLVLTLALPRGPDPNSDQVPPELDSAFLLAAEAAKQPPTAQGGFVVRITSPVGCVTYAPLRGLPENDLVAAEVFRLTNPEGLPLTADDGDAAPPQADARDGAILWREIGPTGKGILCFVAGAVAMGVAMLPGAF